MPGCGSGAAVCSCSLLFGCHLGRRQAETPIIPLSKFSRPALNRLVTKHGKLRGQALGLPEDAETAAAERGLARRLGGIAWFTRWCGTSQLSCSTWTGDFPACQVSVDTYSKQRQPRG